MFNKKKEKSLVPCHAIVLKSSPRGNNLKYIFLFFFEKTKHKNAVIKSQLYNAIEDFDFFFHSTSETKVADR